MPFLSLKQLLAPRRVAPVSVPHRVVALCRDRSAVLVEKIITQTLLFAPFHVQGIARAVMNDGYTRVQLEVSCAEADHRLLVNLISRLGLEADVRSVRWEHGAEQASHAHGIAGNRYFPGTITFDDPAVADEMILPARSRTVVAGEEGRVVDREVTWAFMRLPTPTMGVGMDGGNTRRNWGHAQSVGATPVHVTLKSELYRDEPDEALVSGSVAWGVGGSGAPKVGANAPNTLDAGVYFGQGLGNLPDKLSWLRPFGIAGAAVVETPLSGRLSANQVQDMAAGTPSTVMSKTGTVLRWGFAPEYSTLYLTDRFDGKPPKAEPLRQWVPLVEFAFESRRGSKTSGSINPGIRYVAETWQVAVEAVRPWRQASHDIGVRAQLPFFLDDLAPSLFSQPLLRR